MHPTLCVLLCGTNDAYYFTPTANFQASLNVLLNRLQAARITTVVVTPPNFAVGSTFQNRDLNTSLAPIVAILQATAAQRGLAVADVNKAVIALKPDGIHPNAAGQTAIAQVVVPVVQFAIGTHLR